MVAATLLALLLLLGWAAFNRPVTTSLADGTTFELASVNVALTNTLVRGTFLGRLAEKWIPANGWKVGNFRVYFTIKAGLICWWRPSSCSRGHPA
jgi:hypothetical protein